MGSMTGSRFQMVTHGQSHMKLFIRTSKSVFNGFSIILNLVLWRADIFLDSAQYFLISPKIQLRGIFPIAIKVMACLEQQETAEYYHWLFRIEQTEFEKELLDIVRISNTMKFNLSQNHFNPLLMFMTRLNQYIMSIGFQKNIIHSRQSCAGHSQL